MEGHIDKGNVDIKAQIAELSQQEGKRNGRRQLEQEFHPCREAVSVVVLHLHIVVDIADDAEDQREEEDKPAPKLPDAKSSPARRQHRRGNA